MISRFNETSESPTPEGCYIVEIHNHEGDESCSIARARVKPGVTTQLHALHGIDERYVILEGSGLVEVGGESPIQVRALDVVAITAGTRQRITNNGATDLVFLCVCTPRFRNDAYIAL